MPNFTPTKINRANVTKGRRVTLPAILAELEENDQLVFSKTETEGMYIFKKINVPTVNQPQMKKPLYAAVIGQHLGNGRWYGIIMDKTGLIKARVNSSSLLYLRKDLTELSDLKYKKKLDEKCGVGQWLLPVMVESSSMPEGVANTIAECMFGLSNGSWPPE
jgi:hypothetical protein